MVLPQHSRKGKGNNHVPTNMEKCQNTLLKMLEVFANSPLRFLACTIFGNVVAIFFGYKSVFLINMHALCPLITFMSLK